MTKKQISISKSLLKTDEKKIKGEIIAFKDEKYYKIENYDTMPPFFMSIVSESDLWMFLSSNGALSAGRKNPDNAIFPYYTDDRIHDSAEITGNKTIVIISKDDNNYLWEPFSSNCHGLYKVERNIYKNMLGNKVIFEEINHDLSVTFQYQWSNCDKYGFVKTSKITNLASDSIHIDIIDGIQNILPSGIDRKFQLEFSTLVDGYKKNELIPDSKLGLYMLSSVPTDRAEPSEALIATTVWSTGLEDSKILICSDQLNNFKKGLSVDPEIDIRARRGAYFVNSQFTLPNNSTKSWSIVVDINKNQSEVAALTHFILEDEKLQNKIEYAIEQSSDELLLKIAKADGIQLTDDSLNVFRHCSNTLFNIMRGGIFDDNYLIDKNDFISFLKKANKNTAEKYVSIIENLQDQFKFSELNNTSDPNFERLSMEYLPLSFSRRHGDPSRPWNNFSIDIKDEKGNKTLNYQGNWRDIFQNWEALALSFPEYIESMITKFVNASTVDGYNPYRLIREGFDWETLDPEDAWAYIGYWGDHQIIYLQKLLEISNTYHPGKLQELLSKEIYTYANVPYKIKPYNEIVKDPYNTVDYDFDLEKLLEKRIKTIGIDGKFVFDSNENLLYVNLVEKLLVPMLVKFSNFIPEAGIWMNTQRPEWNDANNALVGNGTSMVTLYYLRRHVHFFIDFFNSINAKDFEISDEVFELFAGINGAFNKFSGLLQGTISDQDRKKITDTLSDAGTKHRERIYVDGFCGEKRPISVTDIVSFLETALKYIDHSVEANKREDNLYHAYNLVKFKEDKISIRNLYEMLEGQVAVLSSGMISVEDAVTLLKSLRKSSLYREDQNSYILYPNRERQRFTEKNIIDIEIINQSVLIRKILDSHDTSVVQQDIKGEVHFNSNFRNAAMLKEAMEQQDSFSTEEIQKLADVFEKVFDHQSFTGRSGTFYKFEGLGSIYWHMVSKLLLAVNELILHADSDVDSKSLDELKTIYYDIKDGIGSHKNPENYGAFPTDPYSHTPGNMGVQQPGMTGQVKEDYISRIGELGVVVNEGCISFNPELLNKSEFLSKSEHFHYINSIGKKNVIEVNKGSLAFTISQVPIIYHLSDSNKMKISYCNNDVDIYDGHNLNQETSKLIFTRSHQIQKIEVYIVK